jgi:hypothetical protein
VCGVLQKDFKALSVALFIGPENIYQQEKKKRKRIKIKALRRNEQSRKGANVNVSCLLYKRSGRTMCF